MNADPTSRNTGSIGASSHTQTLFGQVVEQSSRQQRQTAPVPTPPHVSKWVCYRYGGGGYGLCIGIH